MTERKISPGHERGRETVRRLREQAGHSLRGEIESNGLQAGFVGGCGCLGLLGLTALFVPAHLWNSAARPLSDILAQFTVALCAVALVGIAAWYIYRQAKERARDDLRHELTHHMGNLRRVLFDDGLLAMVLGEDPFDAVPGLGQLGGIPGSQVLTRPGGAGRQGFGQRIQVLAEYFAPICEHYRIYPLYAQGTYHVSDVFPRALRGNVYHAYLLVLAEGLLDEPVDLWRLLGGRG